MIDILVHLECKAQHFLHSQQKYLYSKNEVSIDIVSQGEFDQSMKRIGDHVDVLVCGLEHDICECEETYDKIMKFIVIDEKLLEIVGVYFVGGVSYLHYLLQISPAFCFVFQNYHKLFQVFFLLLD